MNKIEWMKKRKIKHKKGKYGHIEGEIEDKDVNLIKALREAEELDVVVDDSNAGDKKIEFTKDQVTNNFYKSLPSKSVLKIHNQKQETDKQNLKEGEDNKQTNNRLEGDQQQRGGELVLSKVDNEQILPLAISEDSNKDIEKIIKEDIDTNNLEKEY